MKETRMMLVAFWRTLAKIVVVFQHKRQRNKSFSRFLDNHKNTDSDSARAALQYANEAYTRTRQTAFQKLLQSS